MSETTSGVIGGFDCHADTHTAAALDPLGRLLGTATFDATIDGYRQATRRLGAFGPIVAEDEDGPDKILVLFADRIFRVAEGAGNK